MINCPSVNPIATKDDLEFIKLSSYSGCETSNGTGTHEVEVIRTDVVSVPNLKKTGDTSDKIPSKKTDSTSQSTEYLSSSSMFMSPPSHLSVRNSSAKKVRNKSKQHSNNDISSMVSLREKGLLMNEKYKKREVEVMEKEFICKALKWKEEAKEITQRKKYNLVLNRLDLRKKGVPEDEINNLLFLE